MNEATERGYNTNLEFRNKRFKTLREEADNVYLSIDELQKIEKIDLKASPKLEKVRDLFLIGCYTGLRFSDFTQINPENIISNNNGNGINVENGGWHYVRQNLILNNIGSGVYSHYSENYIDSKQNGLCESFHANGKIKYRSNYIDGKLV